MRVRPTSVAVLALFAAILALPAAARAQEEAAPTDPITVFVRADMGALVRSSGTSVATRFGPTLQGGLQLTPRLALVVEGSYMVPPSGSAEERARILSALVRFTGHADLYPVTSYFEFGLTGRHIFAPRSTTEQRYMEGDAWAIGAGIDVALNERIGVRGGFQAHIGDLTIRQGSGGLGSIDSRKSTTTRIHLGLGYRFVRGGR